MQRRRLLLLLAACGVPAAAAEPASSPWQRLRGGGHVLLLRHAATDAGIGDPPGFVLGQCATQRNLSRAGRRDAQALGAAVRAHGIPIGTVWSSRWCRCLDTARLAFGRVEAAPLLDSMFQDDDAAVQAKLAGLRRQLAGAAQPGNTVWVTHDVNIRALVREAVAPGEVLVARAVQGRLDVVGRLPY
jgi:broad specificity phosphatase PhoE